MTPHVRCAWWLLAALAVGARAEVGVGVKPPRGAEVLFDGTRATLDAKWTYWTGPGFVSSLPIKWPIIADPAGDGFALRIDDPISRRLEYGMADIVTKEAHRDFRLHVEFLVLNPRGDSGVYLQNRYEIQILDGDRSNSGMGAVMLETKSPYHLYHGLRKWNAYDLQFRAARFKGGELTERARVTVYFNGVKAHTNHECQQVWGGPNSGLDASTTRSRGVTDTAAGIKLQSASRDVCFRNIWVMKVELDGGDTDFEP